MGSEMELRRLVPDPRDEETSADLRKRVRDLEETVMQRNREIEGLRGTINEVIREKNALEHGITSFRKMLSPLHEALLRIFGELDTLELDEQMPAVPQQSAKSAVWQSWKDKLGGKAGAAIDILQMHGKMKREQLKIHLKCGNSTLTDTIYRLNKADLIVKDGTFISLKQL